MMTGPPPRYLNTIPACDYGVRNKQYKSNLFLAVLALAEIASESSVTLRPAQY